MACPAGSSIAIFGAGPVGLAGVMGAKIQGCSTIIVIEPMAVRRDLALALGADHALDPLQGSAVFQRVLASTQGSSSPVAARQQVVWGDARLSAAAIGR